MSDAVKVITIVIGSLHTDLVAVGVRKFPAPGEHVYGKELRIGAGGKSRNIADMLAHLAPAGTVAMVGRTVQDKYGLWKAPMDALARVNVNTDYVNVLTHEQSQKLPGIALIPVDEKGNNQIFVLPGVSDDFSPKDIDDASPLFEIAAKGNGLLVITLECPYDTVKRAVVKANELDLKVIFDPGGIQDDSDLAELLKSGIYLIKPNEHEAQVLTGLKVTDFESAKQAATCLQELGIPNVLITCGANGGYLFTKNEQVHILIPSISETNDRDETGCGDQTMAALCAGIQEGKSMEEATALAITAGTLQFYKSGIQPVEKDELLKAMERL